MVTFIVISVLLLVCIALTFIVLNKFTKDVNNEAKKYFTKKGQEYIDEIKKEEKEENNKELETNIVSEKNDTFICVEDKNKYEINNLFELMKDVDQKFNLNYEKIIKVFAEQEISPLEKERYERLLKIKKYIEQVGVYNLVTTEDVKMIDDFIENVKKIDSKVYNDFQYSRKKFKIQEFSNFIDNELEKYDPNVYVLVGSKQMNYDYIGKNVKTVYNKKIYKGIKIIYRNSMYDYSLS